MWKVYECQKLSHTHTCIILYCYCSAFCLVNVCVMFFVYRISKYKHSLLPTAQHVSTSLWLQKNCEMFAFMLVSKWDCVCVCVCGIVAIKHVICAFFHRLISYMFQLTDRYIYAYTHKHTHNIKIENMKKIYNHAIAFVRAYCANGYVHLWKHLWCVAK